MFEIGELVNQRLENLLNWNEKRATTWGCPYGGNDKDEDCRSRPPVIGQGGGSPGVNSKASRHTLPCCESGEQHSGINLSIDNFLMNIDYWDLGRKYRISNKELRISKGSIPTEQCRTEVRNAVCFQRQSLGYEMDSGWMRNFLHSPSRSVSILFI